MYSFLLLYFILCAKPKDQPINIKFQTIHENSIVLTLWQIPQRIRPQELVQEKSNSMGYNEEVYHHYSILYYWWYFSLCIGDATYYAFLHLYNQAIQTLVVYQFEYFL